MFYCTEVFAFTSDEVISFEFDISNLEPCAITLIYFEVTLLGRKNSFRQMNSFQPKPVLVD